MRRLATLVPVLILAASARADGDSAVGAEAVARAGAGVVAIDDATAIARNPAGLARRSSLRLVVGLALAKQQVGFSTAESFTVKAPEVDGTAGVVTRPWGGAAVGIGDRLVVGAAVLAPTALALEAPAPGYPTDPMIDDRAVAPARYAGTRLEVSRWVAGAGAAVRILPWLAAGAAALAVNTRVEGARTLWAGTTPAARLADLDAAFDVPFAAAADAWSPMTTVGVVAAPPALPLELAVSWAWRGGAHLHGASAAASSRGATAGVARATLSAGSADLELGAETTVRAGVRLLTRRVSVEVDGEAVLRGGDAGPAWSLAGATLKATGGSTASIASIPLGPAFRDSFAVRSALEVPLADGTIVLLAGYAFATAAQTAASVTPVAPSTATHTIAGGVEVRVDTARVTLGVSRDLRVAQETDPGDARVVAPLTTEAAVPAARGRTSGGATVVAFDVELELP